MLGNDLRVYNIAAMVHKIMTFNIFSFKTKLIC